MTDEISLEIKNHTDPLNEFEQRIFCAALSVRSLEKAILILNQARELGITDLRSKEEKAKEATHEYFVERQWKDCSIDRVREEYITEYKCSKCNKTKQEIISKHGFNEEITFDEKITEEGDKTKPCNKT
jgi:hypothetical protein